MTASASIIDTGLRGVTIARTKICDVIGGEGKLIYRGYTIEDLAANSTFEEVAYLLLNEKLPTLSELQSFKECLAAERAVPAALLATIKTFQPQALAMDILQALVAILAQYDPDIRDLSQEAATRKAIRLLAKLPTVIAAWERIRNGLEPISPQPELGHAANFLAMLQGTPPEPEVAHFFDVCLILHAEHSFNASTFAARAVASSRAHIYAACAAAVGALSGELHGGANVKVMEMLLKIGSPERVEEYLQAEFAAGRKIMGLGHAVYKTDDPRVPILAAMAEEMGERTGKKQWFAISKEVEKIGKRLFRERHGREIYVNVDFYTASLYHTMGIPTDFFTLIFAIARVAGWTTHILEEKYAGAAPKPMLYRPKSEYIGNYCAPDSCAYTPISDR